MTDATTNSNIGIESKGDSINWRYLNEERIDDPVISALVKESQNLFINNLKPEIIQHDDKLLNIYISLSY